MACFKDCFVHYIFKTFVSYLLSTRKVSLWLPPFVAAQLLEAWIRLLGEVWKERENWGLWVVM